MLTAFDILLTGVAVIILFTGLSRLRASWRMGREEFRPGNIKGLLRYLLGHGRILEKGPAGAAHLAVFWGVLFPLIIALVTQFGFDLPLLPAQVLSLISDVLGAALLAGLVFFLIRRLVIGGFSGPKGAVFPALVLLGIVVSGFFAEGVRLQITDPTVLWPTPMGGLLAAFLPSSPLFMQIMIRVHFFAVLLFLCILPFTFMRHLVASSLNVYYRSNGPRGILREMDLDQGSVGAKQVADLSWKQLLDAQACVSCGRCDAYCPALISGKPLSPRKTILAVQAQTEKSPQFLLESEIGPDEMWACTACMACIAHCPVYAAPMDQLVEMRRHQTMGRGLLPEEARPMIRDLEIYGDVYGKGMAYKEGWIWDLDVPHIKEQVQGDGILLWVGCSGAFHPRYQETTRSMVRILNAVGVPFGILGKEELCCGDPARRLGDEERFQSLARRNIQAFEKYGVGKIVCLCPHGFNTLKNEYPALGSSAEVVHAVELVMELIGENRLTLKYPVEKKTAIHDPCYLGRANQLYEPLRTIGRSIPGMELVELERNREKAFCCGGGGGRMWLHESQGEKINELRARELCEAGVDYVATACPFCLTMLEDGINALELERPPQVMDMIDMVETALGRVY